MKKHEFSKKFFLVLRLTKSCQIQITITKLNLFDYIYFEKIKLTR